MVLKAQGAITSVDFATPFGGQLRAAIGKLTNADEGAAFGSDLGVALRVLMGLSVPAVIADRYSAVPIDGIRLAGLRWSGHGVGTIPYTMDDRRLKSKLALRSSGAATVTTGRRRW